MTMPVTSNAKYAHRYDEDTRGRCIVLVSNPTDERMQHYDKVYPAPFFLVLPSRLDYILSKIERTERSMYAMPQTHIDRRVVSELDLV